MPEANTTTTETPEEKPEEKPETDLGDAGKKALDEERAARRDAERQLKVHQRELEQLRQSTMTETEKAVAQARTEAKAEARREHAESLVAAEVKAAAAGRKVDVPALLDGLNRARFVTDDGDVDSKAIAAWIDKVAPKPNADLGQGNRGSAAPGDMNALIRERMRSR